MKEIENTKGLVDPTEDETVPADDGPADPMSPEYAPGLSLIVQMRIYDVMLTLLRESNPHVAEQLVNMHAEGQFLGPMPYASEDLN